MPLSAFHPAVARWFTERFAEPTPPQARGWEAIRAGRHTLIAAPTGSGKTLAAFLSALDDLLREGLERDLPDEVRVVYVSPLKALSADIHQNLAEPRREIRQVAEGMELSPVKITAAVRTGDTPASQRAAMLKRPPHILVTTPESLYLLLTAQRSREMLRTVRTVIVDEIHAVIESRRGAHLALSLERLQHVAQAPLQRIGLSATQKPVEEVARFLVGAGGLDANGDADCVIVDEGHRRTADLTIEIPSSPLEAVMSGEVWQEIYDRLAQLIAEHRTTLVFVNTRRMAERVARHLSDRLGEEAVTAHHGSLAKEVRVSAERRLKGGELKALVATASLELGIDIGYVDLVCQLGSPHRIATFLQRVGRSGHTVHGTPKGRLFPLSRDDLVECAALMRVVRRGELDRLLMLQRPLDVLAQQVVAEAACEDWQEDDLFALARRAYPYAPLERREFDEVVQMAARGFSTRRGRRGALLHYDGVNGRIRGRRGARMRAITSGGAIPDNADYRVVLEPEGTFIGTVNEDFAFESVAGDIFQLGNTSWRILGIQAGVVRVEDARGQPPNLPFWLGEAPARSDELSAAVSELRQQLGTRLDDHDAAVEWLVDEIGLSRPAAGQLVQYLADARRLLGMLPTQRTLVAERFFDTSGGMQLVVHAPFGGRVNRAWGLALRKRFCRQFNFELQAAATEDALLLSLGPQHSFPLKDVFSYLHPSTARDILIQALLDAPMFQTRWRWNATTALAVLRNRGGRKVAPQVQRMESEDLLAAVFPDAAACLENIAGDREVPDHPLVRQTIEDCLTEAMNVDRLTSLLGEIRAGDVECVARDLPEPSPLTHEILNARPYAFLDDAPLEERRAQAVYTRRAFEPSSASDLGALDAAAIERVRDEAWPDPENADELHDALLMSGFLTKEEGGRAVRRSGGQTGDTLFSELRIASRAAQVGFDTAAGHCSLWVAMERVPELRAVHPEAVVEPEGIAAPVAEPQPDRQTAIRELMRGRLEIAGPITVRTLAESLGIDEAEADVALAALEAEGVVLRGHFTPQPGTGEAADRSPLPAPHSPIEWCDRRLLARIHRYTLNRLRAEIAPVSPADFMRFLFAWQRIDVEHRAQGIEGLLAVIDSLDGYELAAGAWEMDVLAARCDEYDPLLLDTLCLTGRVAWGRLSPLVQASSGPVRSTPVALFLRDHQETWLRLARAGEGATPSTNARVVLDILEQRGASFFQELVAATGLLATQLEQVLGELVALGMVTSDSFAGLRALLTPSQKRKPRGAGRRRHKTAPFGIESAGRWVLLRRNGGTMERRNDGTAKRQSDGMAERRNDGTAEASNESPHGHPAAEPPIRRSVETLARVLLKRYGVVFRRLLTRESIMVPWRELLLVYRRLEARGEIRGGRFVTGMSGEQFALPEAVGQMRTVRKRESTGQLVGLSGADPMNLTGIVTPGERIPALATNRVLYRDGVPIAALEGGKIRPLADYDAARAAEIERALVRKRVSPVLRAYLGKGGREVGATVEPWRRRARPRVARDSGSSES
ncbi:MAG: DEAD/DEAH box helicase [Gemmatimonadales bacterium]|nr:DEAD/DEAH box helicase [Gemmatimonadales bacterium]NIN48806.1 DEAD/DEAH box helicase [Gemmatimonadales bacterium]NIP06270.1 DEAD/DEAH box helicase [Gemmatimonadales bacterium]NIR02678.1 DEAD/DEAH box helicase [Gemmatimonadales bacterium]NIS66328.1 DEAD/DEAH box helicase [Gemmatimonadales bacterium]